MKALYTKKVAFRTYLWTILAAVTAYAVLMFLNFEVLPLESVFISAVVALLIFFIVYKFNIVKPLNVILEQMNFLLSNRKYKKIYSQRTDEIGLIAHFFNQVTDSFETVSEEIRKNKLVSGELKTAGQLQKELIPNTAPTIKGIEIAVKNRSAEDLGGDNFDFITVGSKSYIYLGDVTGHGVPAAIIMTMVNTLINTFAEIYETAYEIIVNTNKRLKKRVKSTMFMSMVMLKWDSMSRKMSFVGCGHEYVLVYKAKEATVTAIKSGGIALGMVPDNSKIVKEIDIPMEDGDFVVLYTDGITEAKNMKGEMFGLERLRKSVEKYAGQDDSQILLQSIAREFSLFVEDHVQEDDVTLLIIKKLAETQDSKSFIDQKQERWQNTAETDSGTVKEGLMN